MTNAKPARARRSPTDVLQTKVATLEAQVETILLIKIPELVAALQKLSDLLAKSEAAAATRTTATIDAVVEQIRQMMLQIITAAAKQAAITSLKSAMGLGISALGAYAVAHWSGLSH